MPVKAGDPSVAAAGAASHHRAFRVALGIVALVVAAIAAPGASSVTVFGPRTLVRTTGAPNVFVFTFDVYNPSLPYTLRFDTDGLASAIVTLNGTDVVVPSDFNPGVTVLERSVLLRRSNTLRIELRSKPGTTLTVRILGTDNDPPTITAIAQPPANAAGWNRTDVQVTFTCADAGSGVASCASPRTITTEGQGQVVTGTAVDNAGNTASASVRLNIDKTPPAIAASVQPQPNADGWLNQPATVGFTCTDGLSGVGTCPPPVALQSEGANQVVDGTAVDIAGNSAATRVSVNVDRTPPTITATVSPRPNVAGWNNTDVIVTFTCADATSGIAVCPSPVTVSSEGANQVISGTARDRAGNTASTSITLNVDKTPLSIVPHVQPAPNAAGWNNSDVTVTFTCNDAGSGFATCAAPVTVTTEGANQVVTGTAADAAGNTASASATINIDKTPPSVAITSPSGAALPPSPVTFGGTATDALSGIASTTCNGSAVPPAQNGSVTCAAIEGLNTLGATDLAGNTSIAQINVTLNHAPVVSAGGPYSGTTRAAVAFAATATDPDGDALSFVWDFGDATQPGSGASPTHLYASQGTYTARVTVSDGRGASVVANASVSIAIVNGPPAFTSTPIVNAKHQMPYSYQATATDPDGDAVTFALSQAPAGMTVNGQSGLVEWTPSGGQIGPQSVTVTVTDAFQATATQSFDIVVVDVTPPVVTLELQKEALPGTVVTATADAVDNVGVALVTFEVNGTNPSDRPSAPYQRTIDVPPDAVAGTEFHVRATARDAAGNTGTADRTFKVAAVPDTQPPTIVLNAPPQAAPGTTIRVTASAADNVGVKTITFKADGTALPNDPDHREEATYAIPQNAAVGSSIQFTARAVDFSENLADAAASTLIVAAPDTTPPQVALTAPATVPEGGTLLLSATASDDVGVAGVEFFVNGVTIGTSAVGPYTASLKLPAAIVGGDLLHAEARAFDAAGNEARSRGDTSVLAAPNRPPAANAGGPYAGEVGGLVALTAAASSDPDPADQLSYDWDFGDSSTGSGISPGHAYSAEGVYTAAVTVSDGRGGVSTATATVTVTAATDRTPPSVTLFGPATALPGAQVTMTARAIDDRGVAAVTFEVDGANPTDTSTEPYQRIVAIPPIASPGDRISVRATARDFAGNRGSDEAFITITAVPDTEPPTVAINAPPQAAAGTTVRISATVHDNVGVQSVSISVNGGEPKLFAAPPYEIAYAVAADAAAGSVLGIVAAGTDYTGNRAEATGAVTVVAASDGDSTPPTVKLTAPLEVFAGKKLSLAADAHDNVGVASVAFFVEGVNVATLTSPPYTVGVDLAPAQGPGTLLRLRAVATDFANLQATDSAQTLVVSTSSTGRGVLTGEVYDDFTSLPLGGATIALAGKDATGADYAETTTTDARGRWVLRAAEGQGIVRITKPGWTSIDRSASILVNQALELFDARSTRLNVDGASVSAVLGGSVTSGANALRLPPGALATATTLGLTLISQQGLQGLLPPGWSPVAVADITPHDVSFASPATLSLANTFKIAAGRLIVAARWDETAGAWRAVASLTVPSGGAALEASVSSSGEYAFLLADEAPAVPATPAPGDLVGGISLSPLAGSAVTAVDPQPRILFYAPGVRSDVHGVITTDVPASSGLPIEARLSESYRFLAGSELQPEPFVEDLVFYQVGGPQTGVGGNFGVTPSQTFEAISLQLGVITVELFAPPLGQRMVTTVGGDGGAASSSSGETLQVPQGALAAPLPISVRGLSQDNLGVTLPPGIELAGAALVSFSGLFGKAAVLSVPRPVGVTDAGQVLLVRPQELGGQTRLVLVGRATIVGNQIISDTTLGGVGDAFEGVRVPGRYLFVRTAAPFGFAKGLVSAVGGGAFAGALVSASNVPIVALSAASGGYVAAAAVGAFNLTALDLQRSDSGTASGTMPGAGSIVSLNLQVAAAVPTVTSIVPADGATNVPLSNPIVVRFSRSLDSASVSGQNAGNATLTAPDGSVVAVSVGLSDKNTLLTLRPATALEPSTVYAVNLGTGIADQTGRHLASPFTAHFTSFDTAPPPMPPAGSIQASIPDSSGQTTITATQGTAGVHDTVTIVNLTKRTTTPVLVDPNGGFSVKAAAGLKDKLQIVITAPNGQQTVSDLGRFQNPDGSVVIGPEGGQIEAAGGLRLDVPAGAFPNGSIVRFVPVPQDQIGVDAGAEFPFLAGFDLTSTERPLHYLNVSIPAPAGSTPATQGLVVEVVAVLGGARALSVVDTAKIIDGRLATSSPPCAGILDKFGRYVVLLNDPQQERHLATSLLAMAVPQSRNVIVQAYGVRSFIGIPTVVTPELRFSDGNYAPANPFIVAINHGADVLSTLAAAENPGQFGSSTLTCDPVTGACSQSTQTVCLPIPSDKPLQVVVRDYTTGQVVQTLPQPAVGAGQIGQVAAIFVAPGDTTAPTTQWRSWNATPPYYLDPGEPIAMQFSESVIFAPPPPGQHLVDLIDQLTGRRITTTIQMSNANRHLTIKPDSPLAAGHEYLISIPTLQDLSGNKFTETLTFKMFLPTLITPTASDAFTRKDVADGLTFQGFALSPGFQTAGLKDLDFVTLTPDESNDHKWHTTLTGIGTGRLTGFQLLEINANSPANLEAVGAAGGGDRFYTKVKVLRDIGIEVRPLPPNLLPSVQQQVQKWNGRTLYFDHDNPFDRICDVGDRDIGKWTAPRIAAGRQIDTVSGCGDLALYSSYNLTYTILHVYDVSDPIAPAFFGQRLLADGGAIAGFARRKDAPAGNGVTRGFDVLSHMDITHTLTTPALTSTHADTNGVYAAIKGVGLGLIDLNLNVPDIADKERPREGGTVVESEGLFTLPYYEDAKAFGDKVIAVAGDRTDGSDLKTLEVFPPDLSTPPTSPVPLPLFPNELAVTKGMLFNTGPNGQAEPHDFAFISGWRGGFAAVEVHPDINISPDLVSYVSTPALPDPTQGFIVGNIFFDCPTIEFSMTSGLTTVNVETTATTQFHLGACADVQTGGRITVSGLPAANGTLIAADVTILDHPGKTFITSLHHVEVDKDTKIAYVGADWQVDTGKFQGLLLIDVGRMQGGLIDEDNDGVDDRIMARIPIIGPGQPIQAGTMGGFRLDFARHLIYVAVDGEPHDDDQIPIAVLKMCDCPEPKVVLDSGGTSTSTGVQRSYPSLDGNSAAVFVTADILNAGTVKAKFTLEKDDGNPITYSITEHPFSGNTSDALLDSGLIPASAVFDPAIGQIQLPLLSRPFDTLPSGSVIQIDFKNSAGERVKRATVVLISTRVVAPNARVKTLIDKVNKKMTEFPGALNFLLPNEARVSIKVDGAPIAQGPGQPAFTDVALPAGVNRASITRDMVTMPGEHDFELTAVFRDPDIKTIVHGTIQHDVTITENLPVGHSFVEGVDLHDGHVAISREDLSIPGVGPTLHFMRSYGSAGNRESGPMGAGWSHNYQSTLTIDATGVVTISGGEGGGGRFTQAGGTPGAGATFKPEAGYHGSLAANAGGYDFFTKGQFKYHYDPPTTAALDANVYHLAYTEDTHGNRLSLAYAGDQLTRVADASGRTLTLTYAKAGVVAEDRISDIDGPLGLHVHFDYDDFGNLVRATRSDLQPGSEKRVEEYQYSVTQAQDRHNLTKVIDPNGNPIEYVYYAAADLFPGENSDFQWGREVLLIPQKFELVKEIRKGSGADLAVTKYSYDYSQSATKTKTTVVDPRLTSTVYTMHPRGAVQETRIATPAGDNVTKVRWAFEDGIDDVYVTQKIDPNGRTTNYTYDANGNLKTETVDLTTISSYAPVRDALGQPVSTVANSYEYDAKFNRVTKKTDAEGRITEYTLDPQSGDVTGQTTYPGGSLPPIVRHFAYGDVNVASGATLRGVLKSITDPRGKVTVYDAFDQWGNPTRVVDPEGNRSFSTFDARGRALETSDDFGRHAIMTYDALDRVRTTTRFAGQQPADTAMHSPDASAAIEYFPAGQKKKVTDGLGHLTTLAYDSFNRVKSVTDEIADADGNSTPLISTYTYDGNGNALTETDRRGILHVMTYDVLNRLETVTIGSIKTGTYTYDAAGNRLTDTDLHGHTTSYGYDGLYRSVTKTLPLTQYVETTQYDRVGNVLSKTDANGHGATMTYDGVNRLLSSTSPVGITTIYEYDAAGNRLSEANTATGLTIAAGAYDGLNRPTTSARTFTDPLTGSTTTYHESWHYIDSDHAVEFTNARNVVTRTQYNGLDQVIAKTVDPGGLGLTTTYQFDGNGNLAGVKDPEGPDPDEVSTYDGLNRRVRIDSPLGGVRKFFYNGNGNLERAIDRRGIVTEHEYDAVGRAIRDSVIESITNGGHRLDVLRMAYDDAANTSQATDAKGNNTQHAFDAMHREVLTTDALTRTVKSQWDGVNKVSVTDRRGFVTQYSYDAANRMTRVDELGGGTALTTTYFDHDNRRVDTDRRGIQQITQFDALGRTRRISRAHPSLTSEYGSATITQAETDYDGNGNTVEVRDANGNRTTFTYDSADRRATMTEGAGSTVAASTTYARDGAGNVLTITDALRHQTHFTYDARYRKIRQENAAGDVTSFTYDQEDELLAVTEPNGPQFATAYTYDELQQLLTVDETRGGAGGVTKYTYDANRNRLSETDASGNVKTYQYDALNRVTDSFEAGAVHWRREYDASGNESTIVDPAGQRVSKTYDYLNRLVTRSYANHKLGADGAEIFPKLLSISYQYDGSGNPTLVTEHKQLAAQQPAVDERTQTAYDHLDRVGQTVNFDGKIVTNTYDAQGNRTSVTDTDQIVTRYAFDARHRIATVSAEHGSTTGQTSYTYFANGLQQSTAYPNAVTASYTYGANDRLTQIVNSVNGALVSQYDYTYDANGNRLSQAERHQSINGGAPAVTTYRYDTANRLANVDYGGGVSVAYTYAPNGNRLTETGTDPISQSPVNRAYTYNAQNELTRFVDSANPPSSTTFTYDPNGNLLRTESGAGTRSFEYDVRDNLVKVDAIGGGNGVSFDYDFAGRRVKSISPFANIRFVQDSAGVLQEYDGATGSTTLKYNYGNGLLSMVTQNVSVRRPFYYLFDGLRSASELTDQNGGIQATYQFDAWGGVRSSHDMTPNRRKYTSHYFDSETGLQYFNARYYDSGTGRFLSQDPLQGNVAAPPSLHRYLYAQANPLYYVDPTGLENEPAQPIGNEWYSGLGDWSVQVGKGLLAAAGAPVAGLARSAVLGLGDVAEAGIGYLAMEATGHKYDDEIGGLLTPMSDIGKAAAQKGTLTAIKESATGFVKDSVTGIVTLPQRLIEASASGDPEKLGMVIGEAGLVSTLAKLGVKAIGEQLERRAASVEAAAAAEEVATRDVAASIRNEGVTAASEEVTQRINVKDLERDAITQKIDARDLQRKWAEEERRSASEITKEIDISKVEREGQQRINFRGADELKPSKRVDIFGPKDDLAISAPHIEPIKGTLDVVIHGNAEMVGVKFGDKVVPLTAEHVAAIIRQAGGWSGEPIRLIACSTGACLTGFAQQLANELGKDVEVWAPTDKIWAPSMKIENGGRMRLFVGK